MREKIKWLIKSNRTYFIFCEWETEKCYFSALSEYLKDYNYINYKIEPIKNWQLWTTEDKLKNSKDIILRKLYQEYWYNESNLIKLNSKIFIILDTDWANWYTKEQINTIKDFFKNDKLIKVLFTNRDFELYILLHLDYYNWTSSDYISIIKKYHRNFNKWINIELKNIHREIIKNGFSSILPRNIEKLEKEHLDIWNNHIKDMLPFSEVYDIFK